MSQLALPLRLADHAVFDSFLGTGNELLVAVLTDLADGGTGPGCWLWGAGATGKTHLLQALCDRAGDRSVYVPLGQLADADPALVAGLESRELICLDDIDAVAADGAWERALFSLCNEVLDASGSLLVAASMAPRECPIALPDLQSRLARLPAFQVQPLADDDRIRALQLRARHRGLELPGDSARYLLTHSRRDMASLYGLLDTLDREALRAQRRLTVPFVRDVLQHLP
jgi:DnaA-homolog protein